jgi:putative transposase
MLNFKKKEWIVKQKIKGELTNQEIADSQNVSKRTVQQLWADFNGSGLDVLREKPLGRKADEIPEKIRKAILKQREKGYGIRKTEAMLNHDGIKISHNKIHRVLKEEGLVTLEPKKGRRKHYLKWERDHSNSLWQTDFCWQENLQCWIIAYLDDHSRFIVAIQYTKLATTEIAIRLFDQAGKKYGFPREVLSDRGTQFCSQRGETCMYSGRLNELGVNHILASVKKPTTCGKLERFWLTHNLERWKFNSLQAFTQYYNFKRPHMSLNYLTPYKVYRRDFRG